MFEFGDKYRGKYDESLRVVKSYYASVSGYMDELLWGATWLYRATDNDHYMSYVVDMAHQLGGLSWAMSEFSWDVKFAGVQLLASMVSILLLIDPFIIIMFQSITRFLIIALRTSNIS